MRECVCVFFAYMVESQIQQVIKARYISCGTNLTVHISFSGRIK